MWPSPPDDSTVVVDSLYDVTNVFPNKPCVHLQHFEIIGKVGEGTYGVVYLARPHNNRSKLLAIKTFKPGKVASACYCMHGVSLLH